MQQEQQMKHHKLKFHFNFNRLAVFRQVSYFRLQMLQTVSAERQRILYIHAVAFLVVGFVRIDVSSPTRAGLQTIIVRTTKTLHLQL